MFEHLNPTPIQPINSDLYSQAGVEVFIKRDDLIDSEISGNKWRKLKYNLIEAQNQGYKNILTFGGAFSNHIAATAAACKRFGFNSIGIIRGEELNKDSNDTLRKAANDGMQLEFVSRSDYKRREDENWINTLKEKHQAYIIPEGGSNSLAVKGMIEAVNEIDIEFDYISTPVGTGGTMAGLISGLKPNQRAIGISSLKGESYLEDLIKELVGDRPNWTLNHQYHFGGYAKFDSHLVEFINEFYSQKQIPLEPIYTGKMMFALEDLIRQDFFPKGSRIICLHTGGLQGIKGFNAKNNFSLKI